MLRGCYCQEKTWKQLFWYPENLPQLLLCFIKPTATACLSSLQMCLVCTAVLIGYTPRPACARDKPALWKNFRSRQCFSMSCGLTSAGIDAFWTQGKLKHEHLLHVQVFCVSLIAILWFSFGFSGQRQRWDFGQRMRMFQGWERLEPIRKYNFNLTTRWKWSRQQHLRTKLVFLKTAENQPSSECAHSVTPHTNELCLDCTQARKIRGVFAAYYLLVLHTSGQY